MDRVRLNAVDLTAVACAGVLGLTLAIAGQTVTAAEWTVEDVTLQPGGVLQGSVAATKGVPAATQRVWLVRDGQMVAEAGVDRQGYFVLQRLSPGVVAIACGDHGPTHSGWFRLWATGTSPPGAADTVQLSPSKAIVRGQGGFLTMGFRRAASIAGIAAGAIAAPAIHQNIQNDHRPPHTP